MALLLGIFREGINTVLFRLRSTVPLNPVTVRLLTTDHLGFSQEIPMSGFGSDMEFTGTWDTTGRALGLATAEATAEDAVGHAGSAAGEVQLTSSYGRHYGEDYGNGI